ncbi:Sec34-like family-domain-containing protein [Panaeolus papilionaceus]|nr:Sec34-like family-domain-containing protein [Panaeolus papilionaceus]
MSRIAAAGSRKGAAPTTLSLSTSQRGASQTSNDGQLKPGRTVTISVEDWEAKTPLTDLQMRSIGEIQAATERAKREAVPLKFVSEPPGSENAPGTPRTPIQKVANKLLNQAQSQGGSRPPTPRANAQTHPLHPSHPIITPQQFYDWYALIDRSVAHSQESSYRAHVATLSSHLATCDLLLNRVNSVDKEATSMLESWRSVEEGGKSLKEACERVLEERDNLLTLVEDIGEHLEYFQQLEQATRMLNHPGESLIFQADFLYMVERVDICIDFLKNHRHYREADVYLLRFQQCMTRAMTLIKMNFVGSLRALTSEVSKRLADKDISPTAQHHLLYTRFLSVSNRLSPMLGELERRAKSYPDELSALLDECRSAYFSTRKALVVPWVMLEIKGLDAERSELVELTRSGCGYLKQLCTEEFNLYRHFFSTAEDQLYQYLESLCDLLYDDLRPRILHEPRLTVLCEVCTVLQALMVLDSSTNIDHDGDSSSDNDEDDDTDTLSSSDSKSADQLTTDLSQAPRQGQENGKVGKRLHTSQLLKMVLQDAQTRLFFKAQSVIQSEIRHFVPREEDLKYPAILVDANKPPTGTEIREKESVSSIFARSKGSLSFMEKQNTWYPTLKKTTWVLGQLRDFVKPAIFEDISQEALSFCRLSLVAASDLIRTKQLPQAPSQGGTPQQNPYALDAYLFLARHILILKEIVASLEADLRERGAENGHGYEAGPSDKGPGGSRTGDFGLSTLPAGGVTETLTNMFSKTTSLLPIPESLFASLGVTKNGAGDLRGVKMEIDQTLRKACEDVITTAASPVNAPLESWLRTVSQSQPLSTSAQTSDIPSSALPSTMNGSSYISIPIPKKESMDQISNVQLAFMQAIQRDLRASSGRIRLYLEDERTARVLLDHVVDRIVDEYVAWRGVVAKGDSTLLPAGVDFLAPAKLRETLREVCGDSLS